jgi:hypothetical protein
MHLPEGGRLPNRIYAAMFEKEGYRESLDKWIAQRLRNGFGFGIEPDLPTILETDR